MAFSSLEFVFLFLPAMLAAYYITPPKVRGVTMLLGSLFFYWWGVRSNPWMLGLLLVLMAWTYGAGVVMVYHRAWARTILVLSWTVLFGTLLFFKYMGLFAESPLPLPAGISFYTFTMAAYLADVARRKGPADWNPLRFANGVLLFPKLLSGPITPLTSVRRPCCRVSNFNLGLREFIWGLGLKLLLADQLGGLWRQLGNIGYESVSAPLAWLGLVAFSLQLYFDFYGYSKMAVGVGHMLGYHLPENFDHPYASRTMTEFWRRWHITLGAWFRDYIYIPLGGSRCSSGQHICNLLIVWICTGLWHGSTLNYLLWGLSLFGLIVLEKRWTGAFFQRHGILCRFYMISACLLTWMLFAIPDLHQLWTFAGRLFTEYSWSAPDFQRHLQQYGGYLAAGILLATPYPERLWRRLQRTAFGTIVLVFIFWAAAYAMAAGQNDPFLYFSF